MVKNPPASAGASGHVGSTAGLGRSPGGGNGNPLQYSCLENSTDRGAWWATVHGVLKNWTRQSDFHSLTQVSYGQVTLLGSKAQAIKTY